MIGHKTKAKIGKQLITINMETRFFTEEEIQLKTNNQ